MAQEAKLWAGAVLNQAELQRQGHDGEVWQGVANVEEKK